MRKFFTCLVIFFQILLIISLVRGTFESFRGKERIEELERRRQELVREKNGLEVEMQEVQNPDYLERVAREELHLAKPGEKVVIIPGGVIGENKEQGILNIERDKPNWRKWWEVVVGN